MTTIQIGIPRSGPQPFQSAAATHAGAHGVINLIVMGALAAIGGVILPTVAATLLVIAYAGSASDTTQVAMLGSPFLAITASTTVIWLHGAFQTRRTIRRLAPVHELMDRAACAELNALLVRE